MNEVGEFFGESKVRIVFDDDAGKWMCATDIARALEYRNPKIAVQDFMRANQELLKGSVCQIRTGRSGGNGMWYFAQNAIMAFLVKTNQPKAVEFQKWAVQVLVDAARKATMGKTEKTLRLRSRQTRNHFTDAAKAHGASKPGHYIELTYKTKVGLGIDKNKRKTECNLLELCRIDLAETLSIYGMEAFNPQGYHEIAPIVEDASKTAAAIPIRTPDTMIGPS